jgi:hypothetical protein
VDNLKFCEITKMSKKQPEKFRRRGQDRRGWGPIPEPPFVDSDGVLVTEDRRKIPDRRKKEEGGDEESDDT